MDRIDGVLDGVDYHQLYLVADDDLWGPPEGSFEDEIAPTPSWYRWITRSVS